MRSKLQSNASKVNCWLIARLNFQIFEYAFRIMNVVHRLVFFIKFMRHEKWYILRLRVFSKNRRISRTLTQHMQLRLSYECVCAGNKATVHDNYQDRKPPPRYCLEDSTLSDQWKNSIVTQLAAWKWMSGTRWSGYQLSVMIQCRRRRKSLGICNHARGAVPTKSFSHHNIKIPEERKQWITIAQYLSVI